MTEDYNIKISEDLKRKMHETEQWCEAVQNIHAQCIDGHVSTRTLRLLDGATMAASNRMIACQLMLVAEVKQQHPDDADLQAILPTLYGKPE